MQSATLLVSLLLSGADGAAKLPIAAPADAGMSEQHLRQVDDVIEQGLRERRMPGCVVAIGRHGRLVYLKAHGHRQLLPEKVPMTIDTVFDLASLTKPIATATSMMVLVESGKVTLHDRVSEYIPEFGRAGKKDITVLQLLTHQSGLIADNPLSDYTHGRQEARARIVALRPVAEPGTKFIYSDVGFIVLGELVERLSGRDLHRFSRANIFEPLDMKETGFLPDEALRRRAAPTERREGAWMRGEVHDPRAFQLGGVAGHAGLFSTAQDLAVYAQMLLGGGEYDGVRILDASTLQTMANSYEVSSGTRGLGWDKLTGYSSNRGEPFTAAAFGHGGFTGTSLWIDPELDLFVIFLSNRVHPSGKGSVNKLAGRIGTIAASAIQDP